MVLLTLALPLALLALLLMMERVERILGEDATLDRLADLLRQSPPDELERVVSEEYATAVDRYWKRRRTLLVNGDRARG